MTNPHKDGRQYDSTDRFFATSRRNVVEARQKQDAISRAYLKFERLHPDLKIVAGGSGDLHMGIRDVHDYCGRRKASNCPMCCYTTAIDQQWESAFYDHVREFIRTPERQGKTRAWKKILVFHPYAGPNSEYVVKYAPRAPEFGLAVYWIPLADSWYYPGQTTTVFCGEADLVERWIHPSIKAACNRIFSV